MMFSRHFRICLLLLAGLFALHQRVEAQGFNLSVSASANVVTTNNSIIYSINLTNQTGLLLTNVSVTNMFSAVIMLLNATNSQGSNSIVSPSLIFKLGALTNGSSAQMMVTVQPTTPGFLTNTIVAVATGTTNTATTNIVTQIFIAQADLGVTIAGPVQAVITNDFTSYDVTVTNAGPDAAPGVMLTNFLPAGIILKGASQSYALSGSNLVVSLGTLAGGGSAAVRFFIEPTNAGTLTLAAAVGAPNLWETNTANNFFSTNITVIGYLPGTLVAVTNSGQAVNLQNGLTEQSILLSNIGATDVPAARVVVSGLANQLFNAVGTNNGSPFVDYSAGLPAGQSVNLLLQYNPRGLFSFTNGQLHAYAVPLPDWTPPPITATSTNLNLSRIVKLTNGNMLIEFPATAGKAYTVVYADNIMFSNAVIAPPAIIAPANRVQWIDYGPPTAVSPPSATGARFYRVFQNP